MLLSRTTNCYISMFKYLLNFTSVTTWTCSYIKEIRTSHALLTLSYITNITRRIQTLIIKISSNAIVFTLLIFYEMSGRTIKLTDKVLFIIPNIALADTNGKLLIYIVLIFHTMWTLLYAFISKKRKLIWTTWYTFVWFIIMSVS